MKWAFLSVLLLLASCNDHTQEVDDAINNLEWIDYKLDEIGEQSIPGYKSTIYVNGINDDKHNDSITISEEQYRNIQNKLYSVIKDLEILSQEMAKQYETD